MGLYQFATRSRVHGFFFSCCLSLVDLFVLTVIFHEKWSIWRGILIALGVAILLQLSGAYNKNRKSCITPTRTNLPPSVVQTRATKESVHIEENTGAMAMELSSVSTGPSARKITEAPTRVPISSPRKLPRKNPPPHLSRAATKTPTLLARKIN
ncbi:hypothetical protein HY772_04005 [Candidatus Woesearchaeota archaeon]|nr:hypothetical protein [Candidatus Woesearchaeota archaeon]